MIYIDNLSKIFSIGTKNEFTALENINFKIKKGECVVIKGTSGSGKSTLLSILGAMSKPTSGAVLINEMNYAKLPDDTVSEFRANQIGFIFQSYNLIDGLTVIQNIEAPMICKNLPPEEKLKRVQYAKELANILDKDNTFAKDLSGGEKQRCAIARALINNPDIIIADEPTANLDKNNSLYFIETMKKLKALGKTIIIATHDDIFENSDLSDKIIKMEYGKIVNHPFEMEKL